MIEKMAKHEHDMWSGWMVYLFSKCTISDDGTVTIPKWAVERWTRQMNTEYANLPEEEKESDRKEAKSIIDITGEGNITIVKVEDFTWPVERNYAHS